VAFLLLRTKPFLALVLLALLGTASPALAGPGADGNWRILPPPSTSNTRFTFVDPVDGRLSLLQGFDQGNLWKFDLSGNAGWSNHAIAGFPGVNETTAILLDAAGRRLLVVGHDQDFDTLGIRLGHEEVWQLPLEGERRWAPVPSPASGPEGRHGATIALDPDQGALYLVGGHTHPRPQPIDFQTLPPETWTFDLDGGAGWSILPIDGTDLPPGEDGYAMFDRTGQRFIVFGHRDTLDNGIDELRISALTLDGFRAWSTLSPTMAVPGVPYGNPTHDPVANRVLFLRPANFDQPADSCSVLEFDPAGPGAWRRMYFGGTIAPGDVGERNLCVDPSTHELIVHGTRNLIDRFSRVDVWSASLAPGAPWSRKFDSVSAEEVWSRIPLLFDPQRRELISLGRSSNEAQVFRFKVDDPNAWAVVPVTGPGPVLERSGAVAVFDAPGDRVLLFGGGWDSFELGDLWELSFAVEPPRWRRIVTDDEAPRPRQGASAVFDPLRRRMILFGGYAGEPLNDTWELDLTAADPAWHRVETRGASPPARWSHSATYDSRRNAMVVYGGAAGPFTSPSALADTWVLSFADCDAWIPAPISGSLPLARWGHSADYDPVADRMIVLGGRDRSGPRFDHHALEFEAPFRWADFLSQGTLPPTATDASLRYDPAADRMLFMSTIRPEVFALEWNRSSTPEPPSGGSVAFRILGVGPNPSRGDVNIAFELPRISTVQTRLYDARGRLVRDLGRAQYQPGPHIVCWDGTDDAGSRLRDGVYFARMIVDGQAVSGKIVLMD
jgi:hypothetical protein